MAEPLSDMIDALEAEFPQLTRSAIASQVHDAADNAAMFGYDEADRPRLVTQLARSHLAALAALRDA